MPVRLPLRRLILVSLLILGLSALTVPAKARLGPTHWDCLAHYESTHRWHISSGNGHYGGLQFSMSTWRYYGGPKYSHNRFPHKATRREQIVIGKRTAWKGWKGRAAQGGRSAWPNTWQRCH
jgi:hypothetical protein